MLLLYFLRILGDLSQYFAFAGFIAVLCGGELSPLCLLLPALCYALSARLQKHTVLRLLVLVPQMFCLFLSGTTLVALLACLPPIGYTVYLVITQNYELSHYRQQDVFLMFCKIYSGFFLLLCLLGGFQMLASSSLPYAITVTVISVFLLRILRHQPEVYCQADLLLRNALPLCGILLLAWLLQLPIVRAAAQSGLYALYSVTIVPLIVLIGYGLMFLYMHTLHPILTYLVGIFQSETVETESELTTDAVADTLSYESGSLNPVVRQLLIVLFALLLIAFVVYLVLRLFRRLSGSFRDGTDSAAIQTTRTSTHSSASTGGRFPFFTSADPVSQLRRQYRRYLALCQKRGYTPHPSLTSGEILDDTTGLFPGTSAEAELRSLYIAARYRGTATHEDVLRAKTLVNQLKSAPKAS